MKKVRVVGVPEHFNLPWHMALEEGAFEDRGIELEWTDIPEGTGRMADMLAKGETDLAIILTEGVIKAISDGNPSMILQEYIGSPLLWGIHVGADSYFKALSELKNTKAAISRFGSGSHLMAFVNAQNNGWDTSRLQFEVVNNLEGAVEALTQGSADYFMWEHFTTKPLVDQGIFRRLGDCPTPWPCFVVAATKSFVEKDPAPARHVLEVINNYTAEFASIPSINRTLANRYGQKVSDIDQWLAQTQWSQRPLARKTFDKVQQTLLQLNLINEKKDYAHCVWE
ncbi:MAG: ABC transporter substrate-binding protein [Muricauda sp.]|nr:substrate-binding domain-containing protein [Allomuricauda sp.]MAU27518.1 ABC transporter substrate-binding protein [Allomuricauda sp.]MBC29364.1 ABC transporter substrate-binding protein [Allomuricauda sp.]